MKRLMVLGLGGLLAASLGASQVDTGAAASAGRWRDVPTSARASSLGGLGATGTGVDALFSNPAGLAGLEGLQLALDRSSWIGDSSVQSLAGALPLGPGGLGLALNGVDLGSVDTYTVNAAGTVDQGAPLHPGAWALTAGYGLRLGRLQLGAALAGLREDLQVQTAQGYSLDLGAAADWGPLRLGLGLRGALGQLGGTELPRSLQLEGDWGLWRDGDRALHLLAGLTDGISDRMFSGALGAEGRLGSLLALRAGWRAAGPDDTGGWAAGLGLRPLAWLNLDYAYNAMGALQATHQWSLRLAWGGAAASTGPAPAAAAAPTLAEAAQAPLPAAVLADSFVGQIRSRNYEAASQTAQAMGQPAPEQAHALYQLIKWDDVKQAVFDGRYADAERMLSLIRHLEPGDAAYVEEALGMLAWHQGDYESAEAHFRQAMALDPKLEFLTRYVPPEK